MSSHTIFILGLILFDGVAVAWALWEFWSVKPRRTAKTDEPPAAPHRSPEGPRHPEG